MLNFLVILFLRLQWRWFSWCGVSDCASWCEKRLLSSTKADSSPWRYTTNSFSLSFSTYPCKYVALVAIYSILIHHYYNLNLQIKNCLFVISNWQDLLNVHGITYTIFKKKQHFFNSCLSVCFFRLISETAKLILTKLLQAAKMIYGVTKENIIYLFK